MSAVRRRVLKGAVTICVAAGACTAIAAASATAQVLRQTAHAGPTTAVPGAATGSFFEVEFRNPGDPNGKPYSIARIEVRFSPGTVIDTRAIEQCKASDAELYALGKDACPPGSRLGTGRIVSDTGSTAGFPRFVENDSATFNNEGELIGISESSNAGPVVPGFSRIVTRNRISSQGVDISFPRLPGNGPPEPYTAIKSLRVHTPAVVQGGRPYSTTPPTCPPSGYWTGTLTFIYRDGVQQRVESQAPCTRGSARLVRRDRWAPRVRQRGVPSRRCARRDFTVRVRIGERGGIRRVVAYVDGKVRRVTRRRHFRVRVRAAGMRAGGHRVTVIAHDAAGNHARRTKRFRRCRG